MRGGVSRRSAGGVFALPREAAHVTKALVKHGVFGLPWRVGRALAKEPGLPRAFPSQERLCELFGENAVSLFDDLGPIYGKAGQILLSRLTPELHAIAATLRLTRLYKDWPPLSFSAVEKILDREVPRWRTELSLESFPLGVASIAQVHAAVDAEGREWVVKIVKPAARARLLDTVHALEELATRLTPLAVTFTSRRMLKETRELCLGFRREIDLSRERETISRVHDKLRARRQKTLVIPDVHPDLGSESVLIVERFRGVSLADVASGHVELPAAARQKLAKTMLSELLV